MKFFAALIGSIALLPLPAIASPEPLNMPACYMITSRGNLLDLTRMCGIGFLTRATSTSSITESSSSSSVTSSSSVCPKDFYIDRSGACRWIGAPDYLIDQTSGMGGRNPGIPVTNSGSATGNCQYSWQTASDGSRCGGRASDQR